MNRVLAAWASREYALIEIRKVATTVAREVDLRQVRHPVIEEDLRRIVSVDLPWGRFSGKTVLITGANGFLPAYMLEVLLYLNETARTGVHVIALVRNREKAMRRLGGLIGRSDLTLVVQDVRDPY